MNWLPIYTNTLPWLLDFSDSDATNFPAALLSHDLA